MRGGGGRTGGGWAGGELWLWRRAAAGASAAAITVGRERRALPEAFAPGPGQGGWCARDGQHQGRQQQRTRSTRHWRPPGWRQRAASGGQAGRSSCGVQLVSAPRSAVQLCAEVSPVCSHCWILQSNERKPVVPFRMSEAPNLCQFWAHKPITMHISVLDSCVSC